MALVPPTKDNDPTGTRQAIQKLASIKLGPSSTPTFGGITSIGVIGAANFIKTGWPLVTGATFSFDNSTRTFTVTDGGSAYYYINGIKYKLKGNKTVIITDTEGLWYIYFDGEILTASQTIWSFIAEDKALVSTLYWDATNNKEIFLGWEAHTFFMEGATHARLHYAGGARWETGLVVADTGSETVNVTAGDMWDEDLNIPITDGAGSSLFEQVLSPAELPIYYRDGTSAWRIYETTDKANTTDVGYVDGSNDLKYNKLNGTWANATVELNNYVAYYVVATNEQTEPVALIMGQRVDNKLSDAKENNIFGGLSLSGLPFEEMVVLARLILKDTGSGVYYTLEEVLDLRVFNVKGNITSPLITEHGGLSGLGDDDHSQYIKDSEFTQNSGILVGTAAGIFQEETGATLRTSIGLGTGDTPTFAALNVSGLVTITRMSVQLILEYDDANTVEFEVGATGKLVLSVSGSEIGFGASSLTNIATATVEQLTSTDDITMQGHLLTLGNVGSAADVVISFLSSGNTASIIYDQTDMEFDFGSSALTTIGTATVGTLLATAATITNATISSNLNADSMIITAPAVSNIKIGGYSNTTMFFEGQNAGSAMAIDLFTKTGDASVSCTWSLFGKGTLALHTDYEKLIIGYLSGTTTYLCASLSGGTGTARPLLLYTTGNTDQLRLNINGYIVMATLPVGTGTPLELDGSNQIVRNTSSIVYKTNVKDLNNTERIYNLRPISYDSVDGEDTNLIGLVAEEVNEVMPELICYKHNKIIETSWDEDVGLIENIVGYEKTNIPEAVNYSRLIVPVLKELQLLRKKVDTLLNE